MTPDSSFSKFLRHPSALLSSPPKARPSNPHGTPGPSQTPRPPHAPFFVGLWLRVKHTRWHVLQPGSNIYLTLILWARTCLQNYLFGRAMFAKDIRWWDVQDWNLQQELPLVIALKASTEEPCLFGSLLACARLYVCVYVSVCVCDWSLTVICVCSCA